MSDPTEDLFSGLDRPRDLPPELRQRLEEQLLAATGAATEVPLGRELDERLRSQLVDPVAATLAGIDAPLALGPALRGRLEGQLLRRRRRARAFLGAAAAVVVVGAVALILAPNSSPRHPAASAARPVAPSALGGVSATPQSAPGAAGVAAGGTGSKVAGPPIPGPAAVAGVTGAGNEALLSERADVRRAVDPQVGPLDGGTVVTLRGGGLGSTRAVLFGPAQASFQVLSDSTVRAVTPAAAQGGPVDVVVRLASGATYRYPAAFRYVVTSSGRRHPSAG